MAEFIECSGELKDQLPNQNKIILRFKLNSNFCIPQPMVPKYTCESSSSFILNNLLWCLDVVTSSGEISIRLRCLSNTPNPWSSKINGRITILNTVSNEQEHIEYIPSIVTNKTNLWLLEDYIINPNYIKSETVTIELWINVKSNPERALDVETFLKWHEKFQQRIHSELNLHQNQVKELATMYNLKIETEELRLKLADFEPVKKKFNMQQVENIYSGEKNNVEHHQLNTEEVGINNKNTIEYEQELVQIKKENLEINEEYVDLKATNVNDDPQDEINILQQTCLDDLEATSKELSVQLASLEQRLTNLL